MRFVRGKIKKLLVRNDGNTTVLALGFMLVFFAMAVGLLLFASYNSENFDERTAEGQLKRYTIELSDMVSADIKNGMFNQMVSDSVMLAHGVLNKPESPLQGINESYKITTVLTRENGGTEYYNLSHPFTEEEIELTIELEYLPAGYSTVSNHYFLPSKNGMDLLQIGDKMEVLYTVVIDEMEYRASGLYYLSKNTNVQPDGTLLANPKIDGFKWEIERFDNLNYKKN